MKRSLIIMATAGITLAPLAEAVAKLDRRTPIGAALSSAEWADVPLALRERAQFSAHVTSARVVATIQEKLRRRIGLLREQVARGEAYVDRESFIADVRRAAIEEGIDTTEPSGYGTVRDIRSNARLGLIFDQQTRAAAGFAYWKTGNAPEVLDAFPAQELIRVQQRRVPRQWDLRWARAGGRTYNGRMIARKDDEVWTKISRFGTPWPPFDFGSGMGVRDVGREEAEALGVIEPGQKVDSGEQRFNEQLEASVKPEQRRYLADVFGEQVKMVGERAVWVSDAFANVVRRAVESRTWQPAKPPRFGRATRALSDKSREARDGLGLDGTELTLPVDRARHLWDVHGPDSAPSPDNIPLQEADIARFPDVWRRPDRVKFEGVAPFLALEQDVGDGTEYRMIIEKRGPKTARLITGYRREKRKPAQPDAP